MYQELYLVLEFKLNKTDTLLSYTAGNEVGMDDIECGRYNELSKESVTLLHI